MRRAQKAAEDDQWWRVFFESPASLELAFFPNQAETRRQVAALRRLLDGWRAERILDLCCGHGRHMAPLVARGYLVVGLDASALMTEMAWQAVRKTGRTGWVVRGEAQRLPFTNDAFDAVLCLFNSFGYLASDPENEQVIRETARCLRPGGRFLLDTRNRDYQLAHLPFSEIVPLTNGGAVWLKCHYDRARKRVVSEFRTAGSGKLLYRASIRSYSLDELQLMFSRSGLQVTDVFGGYDWTPFEPNSRELLILAAKRLTGTRHTTQ